MDACARVAQQQIRVGLIVGERELYKEERDALEEMRELDGCDMEEFGRLESSEKTIAIKRCKMVATDGELLLLGRGIQDKQTVSMYYMEGKRKERPKVEGVSIRSRNGAPFRTGCVVNSQKTKASNK